MLKIIKWTAPWCQPCKMLTKTFKEVLADEKYSHILYEEMDVEENDDIAIEWKIISVPTTMLMLDGKCISRFSGTRSVSDIKEMLEPYL